MKYEYKHVALPSRAKDGEAALNRLGANGWEVISIAFGVHDDNQAWLRRVIDEKAHRQDASDRANEGDNSISDGTNG